MKTYESFINEISLFSKNKDNELIDRLQQEYPGVLEFIMVAKKWAHEVDSVENPELYELLSSMKGKKRKLSDFTERDFKKIYKYIVRMGLADYDDIEAHFLGD